MELTLKRHRFTTEEFKQLSSVGLFEDRRVELLDGDLIDVTINPPHAQAVTQLQKRFERAYGDRALVYSQNPLELGLEHYLPQPDVMLIRDRTYRDHPGPADVLLLVEVADDSLQKDQTVKKSIYARAGIMEYWLADLNQSLWYVYRRPRGDDYLESQRYRFSDAFAPSAFPDKVGVWLDERGSEP